MEKQWKQSGRFPRRRLLRRGTLPRRPAYGSFTVLLAMVSIIWVTVLTVSCVHADPPEPPEVEESPMAEEEKVMTRLHVMKGAEWCDIRSLDVLVYSSEGMRVLEEHISTEWKEEIILTCTAGMKECVVVANSTKDLKLKILERFDTMQGLTFAYEDEDTAAPVMTARAAFTAGESMDITLEPFLCRVMIDEVCNGMDGWVLMEEPEVWLSGINPEAGILQEKDFRPAATLEEGPSVTLPCDIGYFPQHPGTVLHCYPNDTPERVLGGCRTMLTFRCTVEGEVITQTAALPPSGRNSLTKAKVSMSVDRRLSISF